jgi:heme A synthase
MGQSRGGGRGLGSDAGRPRWPRCAGFAWGVLAYDVAVASWGAYVRATGSGAGCGSHWPLCNGEIVPRTGRIETVIELSHRVSSGLALILTFALLAWVWRALPRGHIARASAVAAAGFMVAEALLGAALVLFELVAHDASMKRALSVGLHLVNTFFLLAATALTAWWASGYPPPRLRDQRPVLWVLGACLSSLLLVGASGAVTALGDTLFPPSSLSAGLAQDFSAGAHLFVRLRTLHPLLAATTAVGVVFASSLVRALRPTRSVRALSRAAVVVVLLQVAAGLLSVTLLAPVWLQMVHLILADAVWIALVLTGAAAVAEVPRCVPHSEGERDNGRPAFT